MKQLRGEELKKAIRKGIERLSAERGASYVFNATELAKHIGTSRVTLNNYRYFIDDVLEGIKAQRRKSNNEGLVAKLRQKVGLLENENANLKEQLQALREHHAAIYDAIYAHSVEGSTILQALPEKRSEATDAEKHPEQSSRSKVIQLSERMAEGDNTN